MLTMGRSSAIGSPISLFSSGLHNTTYVHRICHHRQRDVAEGVVGGALRAPLITTALLVVAEARNNFAAAVVAVEAVVGEALRNHPIITIAVLVVAEAGKDGTVAVAVAAAAVAAVAVVVAAAVVGALLVPSITDLVTTAGGNMTWFQRSEDRLCFSCDVDVIS